MIPEHLRSKITKRITEECGVGDDTIGMFLFGFAALESDRDVEYALEELKASNNPFYKRAINIVLEEILMKAPHAYPSEREEAAAIINAYTHGFPAPYEPWHHIDNANNDLLREMIKQLIIMVNQMKAGLDG